MLEQPEKYKFKLPENGLKWPFYHSHSLHILLSTYFDKNLCECYYYEDQNFSRIKV